MRVERLSRMVGTHIGLAGKASRQVPGEEEKEAGEKKEGVPGPEDGLGGQLISARPWWSTEAED